MSNTAIKQEDDHGKSQAKAQLESILEMVKALETEDDKELEAAERAIHEDALSVETRGGWCNAGCTEAMAEAEEFRILLCTGGPAVQIIGSLDRYKQPEDVRLQYQDWFTPWTDYPLTQEDVDALEKYASQFYYGE